MTVSGYKCVRVCIALLNVSFNLQDQQFSSQCLPEGTSDFAVQLYDSVGRNYMRWF
jgi:hypothetical protein